METIRSNNYKARKEHRCNYCGHVIPKGDTYHRSTHVFDGRLYDWKCHLKCNDLSSEIWNFVDPDEGMTFEDFHDGLKEIADTFICPKCPNWDKEKDDCRKCLSMECIDHIHKFFQTHSLVQRGLFRDWCVEENKSKVKK